MQQKDMMARLQRDPGAVQRVMESSDGQALMQMLSGTDGGTGLQQAMAQASSGNTAQLAEMIRQVMQSPQGAALVRNIGTSLLK
jgi:hypothetical protein